MSRGNTIVIGLLVFLVVFQISLNVMVIAVKPPPVQHRCAPAAPVVLL